MGFDFGIRINLEIDERTGMPIVHYVNNGFLDKKIYDPTEFQIPEKFRKYIEQRGHHFHSYIMQFPESCFETDVNSFLSVYPEWDYVVLQNEIFYIDEEGWNEQSHNEFKEFLEWMVEKSPYISVFQIYWSY
jgi:hypothetical protein